ncbi:TIGR03943 family putative permease subunit [Kitasatospora sp. NPDC056531]|uniref:TIGR03943 family putative permease subunit n=1 Tax=Kitasatospora sp. NPDC056531 TaxID=3345856 RepID=UPI0036D1114E
MAAVRRLLPAALLLLTGSALLRVSLFSALYLRYVKQGLRPALIATGAVLVLLGLVAAVRDLRQARAQDKAHDDHEHVGPGLAWLLAFPAVMLLLFAPPALGAYTVARDGSGAIAKRTGFPPLPAQDPVTLSLGDFSSRAVWDSTESLSGHTVRLTGFAAPGTAGSWRLSRIIVSCCAADARVVKVEIRGVPAPAADSWVAVTGTWRPGTGVPALDATSLTPIAKPASPYRDVP